MNGSEPNMIFNCLIEVCQNWCVLDATEALIAGVGVDTTDNGPSKFRGHPEKK